MTAAGTVGRVRGRIRDGGLVGGGVPLVVLLSGGRDSVCLLDALVAVRGREGIRALHVHHGLRADAEDDVRLCADLCATLGVPVHVERATPPDGPGNIQAWGREVRHAAALTLAVPVDGLVVTGHTRTDQVETVLYRLAAAPGRRALLGMDPRRDRLVRPLLGTTREETGAYCDERGLAFVDDPGNASDAYARSRVRHGVVPALRTVHPAAEENVLRTLEILREEAAALDELVDRVLSGRDDVAVAMLAGLPPGLARLVVRRLAEDATGRLCPRAAARLEDILAGGDAAHDVGDGARAVVRDGRLRFVPTPPLPGA